MCCACEHSSTTHTVIRRDVYCDRRHLTTARTLVLYLHWLGFSDKSAVFFRQKSGLAMSQEGVTRVWISRRGYNRHNEWHIPRGLHSFFSVIPRRPNSEAGELPRRKNTTFRTRRKFEIENIALRFILCVKSPLNCQFKWQFTGVQGLTVVISYVKFHVHE